MLPIHEEDMSEIDPLLKRLHWNYAAKILKAALFAAHTQGLYPVYITSFKCSPDSFTIEYFKRIMDRYGKPYLILNSTSMIPASAMKHGSRRRSVHSAIITRIKTLRVQPGPQPAAEFGKRDPDQGQDSAFPLLRSAQLASWSKQY